MIIWGQMNVEEAPGNRGVGAVQVVGKRKEEINVFGP